MNMVIKNIALLVLSLMLVGCPVPMWMVQPDLNLVGPLNESCIRALIERDDVLGVVKMDLGQHKQPEFDRYFIETISGVVHLDIKHPQSKSQNISFFYSGAGNDVPDQQRVTAKIILNKLAAALESSCQKNS
ncbi:hypothetical protein ACFOEK_20750 [Litoribrevibacter euphylliae]|uniref:Lipoprotein n=1 Tax=Litoribrevibacter euphylliae TaxID=1834034 RepID=A0ABV7HKU7_9GAMM